MAGNNVFPEGALDEAVSLVERHGSIKGAARESGISRSTLRRRHRAAQESRETASFARIQEDYNLNVSERTPRDAWDAHVGAFENKLSKVYRKRWNTIRMPDGPFPIYHSTDEHIDDDAAPLRLIEQDISASHDMGAIMCHGGDVVNNWPTTGRLAQQWSEQSCTRPDSLLRIQHFIELFKPSVWTNGNHDEWNTYLEDLIAQWLPSHAITDHWSVRFRVETPSGRPVRVLMSHQFQKGSSWFHKMHGHIREMLEGEEADLLLDGHLHSDGVLDHTLPERGHNAICVASAGYKVADKYAARISKGGKVPKLRGRSHWIICDPMADYDANLAVPFKCPLQAEAYLSSLQNLRAM